MTPTASGSSFQYTLTGAQNMVKQAVPAELRIRAVRLTKRTAEVVAYGAKAGDWLLHLLDYPGEFRVCSDKTFRRDFRRGK